MRFPRRVRGHAAGVTLVEMAMVLALVALLGAITIVPLMRLTDRIAVRGAASDIATALAVARHRAIMRVTRTTLDVDPTRARILVHTGSDTILVRRLGDAHGVRIAATGLAVTYSPTGLGVGVSNTSITVQRGAAAETVFVSRLGRVRY